jgi:hypothetical protein
MTRIRIIDRAEMDAEQARVYDAAKNAGSVTGGPYYAYIRLPQLFEAAQGLRKCLLAGHLPNRELQIVYLAVARHWNARYPWCAHARAALAAGIEREVIDAINAREPPKLADRRERICFTVPHEMMTRTQLSEETYKLAEETLGLEHLVVVVAIAGMFSMTCLTANAFDVDPPVDAEIPLAE